MTSSASLKVGDPVFLSGVMVTGRDAAHKWMVETFIRKTRPPRATTWPVYEAIKPLLAGGAIYHCGPVVAGLETRRSTVSWPPGRRPASVRSPTRGT